MNKELSAAQEVFQTAFINIKKKEDKRAKKQNKEIEKLKKNYEILEEVSIISRWIDYKYHTKKVLQKLLDRVKEVAETKYKDTENLNVSTLFIDCYLQEMKWRHCFFLIIPKNIENKSVKKVRKSYKKTIV